jgi:hypothetical protein
MLTPHIDSLAATGAALTRFYITSPVCTPSRYTLLTGRLASRSPGFVEKFPPGSHATMGWDTPIGREETSLPKCLQQAGYRTGLVGKWHNFPKDKVFQKEYILPHDSTLADIRKPGVAEGMRANYDKALAILRDGYGWDYVDRINIGSTVFNLEWLLEGALEFIEQNSNRPFFLYVSLPVPHGRASRREDAEHRPTGAARAALHQRPLSRARLHGVAAGADVGQDDVHHRMLRVQRRVPRGPGPGRRRAASQVLQAAGLRNGRRRQTSSWRL